MFSSRRFQDRLENDLVITSGRLAGSAGGAALPHFESAGMAKPGRNDPCPCGSGKKYKQCCLGSATSLLARLPGVIKSEHSKAEQVARRWLGQDDEQDSQPLRDARGKKLRLVLDRYDLSEPEAVAKVAALGKRDEERVLFFDGDQWIGEADFSLPGQLLLITPQVQLADRLKALLAPIAGLKHIDRQVDELPALDAAPTGGASLLEFKRTFFSAWLDEPNQKLDQNTPRQAATELALRPKLVKLLADLESKEARLPKSERFSFSHLKVELGIG